MAWTNPRIWVAGDMVTAALLNTQLRDNLLALALHTHTGTPGDGSAVLGPLASVTMANQGSDPAVAGQLQRVGSDIRYYDGSAVYSLTAHGH